MSDQIQVREGWWRQRCGDVVHVKRDKDSPMRIKTHYPGTANRTTTWTTGEWIRLRNAMWIWWSFLAKKLRFGG